MYSVYEALPEDLKQRIDGLLIKHDGTYNSGGYLRQGITATDDPVTSPGMVWWQRMSRLSAAVDWSIIISYVNSIVFALGAVHPLVCVHPETKRKCLYLGRRRNGYIMGLKLEDSEALLDDLWSRITGQSSSSSIEKGLSETGSPNGPFIWFNEWKVGDSVLWDNRCTMHRRDAFDPNERRVMHRTQIKGNTKPSA